MYVLVTNNNEGQMKNEYARVVKPFYSYILETQGQLTLKLAAKCGQTSNSFKFL